MKQVFLNPIILAIDTKSDLEAYEISQEVSGYVGAIKLGLEYFDTYGPEGIRKIQEIGIPIFLDLKLHDIPMTVKKTIETLSDINPAIINVHALGGQQMMKYALEGLGQIVGVIDQLKKSGANRRLALGGIAMTMYDNRTRLAQEVLQEVKNHYPSEIFKTSIPRTIRLSEAPSFGQTIFEYDPHGLGSKAYLNLGKEVLKRFFPKAKKR